MVNTIEEVIYTELSILEQRELLQSTNPDKLAGVFDLVWEDQEKWYELSNNRNTLCCYPNQLEDGQIQLPEDFNNWEIVILDMWALRKWEVKVIAWSSDKLPEEMKNPILLSPWVIEYWQSEGGKKYTQTVLRDGWKLNSSKWITNLADANQRTTTAGRNFSGSLYGDLEVENAEESPFLMKSEKWEYVLVMPDLKNKEHLVASIENFLKSKYLSPESENYEEVKTKFEVKFKWASYDDLWKILQQIIEKDNFEEYKWGEWEIDGIDKEHVKMWSEEGDFYVFHDKENNTIEYRAIRRITWFPKWLEPIWRIPLRLFLESQNQDPSFKNIRNIAKYGGWATKLVPAIDDFAGKVWNALTK